jgi:hypothetical protein
MSKQNGVSVDDKERQRTARNELELYERVSEPSTDDNFLSENNLGLGNYSSRERWQQVQSFREHMYSESSFVPTVSDFAMYQTEWEMGEDALEDADTDDAVELARERGLIDENEELVGRRVAIRRLGKDEFNQIGKGQFSPEERKKLGMNRKEVEASQKLEKVKEVVGGEASFLTPHSRMISARHETSRSVNAHLIDNLFSRVDEVYQRQDMGSAPKSGSDNGIGLGL